MKLFGDRPQPSPHSHHIPARQPGVPRKQSPSQKRHAVGAAIDPALALVQLQTQAFQTSHDRFPHRCQLRLVVAEKHEIVHISQVEAGPQLSQHEVIQRV